MRKKRNKSIQELINENRMSLLNDKEALSRIYDRLEERLERKRNAE